MSGLLGFGRDTLQSASNAIAGNVSGPVDLINMGLLSLGLPMPANPVGGSRWMAERGLTREVADPYARAAGETLGLVGPMVAAAKAPQIAEGLLNHADAYRRYHAATTAPGAPATVWHGSPHRFDKFDSSKIGKGEGAQAFGHGLYLADSRKVAEGYQKSLGGINVRYADDAAREAANKMMPWGFEDPVAALKGALGDHGDVNRAIKSLRTGWPKNPDKQAHANHLADLLEKGLVRPSPGGALYKVDLPDEAIARMMDWDKPLSQQPEAVRKALWNRVAPNTGMTYGQILEALDAAPHLRNAKDYPWAHPTGGDIYKTFGNSSLVGNVAPGQVEASASLRQAGIPGVRYLDGGSRGVGAGTSNYVVFPGNENLLTILGRE